MSLLNHLPLGLLLASCVIGGPMEAAEVRTSAPPASSGRPSLDPSPAASSPAPGGLNGTSSAETPSIPPATGASSPAPAAPADAGSSAPSTPPSSSPPHPDGTGPDPAGTASSAGPGSSSGPTAPISATAPSDGNTSSGGSPAASAPTSAETQPSVPLGESGAPETEASAPSDARWNTYCDDARKRPRYFTYCIDLQREEVRIPLHQARLMSPDQFLQVVVRYAEGPLKLEVRGQTGAYRPEVEQPLPSSSGMKMAGVGLQSGRERLAIHTFAALLPGHVQIELTHKDTTRSYEVVVQKQLAGALRVGVAFPTLEAVNRRYEAWTPPGSGTTEILEVGAAPVDVELVLGYKHFLRPVLEADAGVKTGVFFGMGILDGAEATLSLARSYYLGVDVGVPSFSLGVAAVIRQTDRLAGGLEPGDAITDAQDIRLDTAWRFGVALIICPAPELFRVSR